MAVPHIFSNTPPNTNVIDADEVNDNFEYLDQASGGAVDHVRVRNSTALAIPHNALTILTFNTEVYDTAGLHSTSTNTSRLTASATGLWGVYGSVTFAASANGLRCYLDLLANGIEAVDVDDPTAATQGTSTAVTRRIYTEVQIAAGGYVELRAFQTQSPGTAARDIQVGANYSPRFGMSYRGSI